MQITYVVNILLQQKIHSGNPRDNKIWGTRYFGKTVLVKISIFHMWCFNFETHSLSLKKSFVSLSSMNYIEIITTNDKMKK
jgi:hypothetical protein